MIIFKRDGSGPEIPHELLKEFAGTPTEGGLLLSKGLELKADANSSENTISGAAASMGNLDRGRDVIFPGCEAFSEAIPGFLKSGSIMVGHKWGNLPVGMPTKCEERGRQLWSEAKFHSTPEAQSARTIALERIAAGLTVGLSIGFRLKSSGYGYFECGDELLEFARETMRLDMSFFDVEAISGCKSWCRGLWKIAELYEWSLVGVPMNPEAVADSAKAIQGLDLSDPQLREKLKKSGFDEETLTRFSDVVGLHKINALVQGKPNNGDPAREAEVTLALGGLDTMLANLGD